MKKARIMLCDDSLFDVKNLQRKIERYASVKNMELHISVCTSGAELLEKIQPVYDVIFLDIRLPDATGDQLADRIRQMDRQVPIVFVSSFLDAIFRGYELNIQNYIRKPVSYGDISKALDRALARNEFEKNSFFWENGVVETMKIYYSRLEYIETGDKCTLLHYDGRVIASQRTMKEYVSFLQDDVFYRCNNSYIVNPWMVDRIVSCGRRYDLELITGEKIPLSRGNKSECVKRLMNLHQNT